MSLKTDWAVIQGEFWVVHRYSGGLDGLGESTLKISVNEKVIVGNENFSLIVWVSSQELGADQI